MTFAKSCPGSRTIREPIPEYATCSNCGNEVEIWTDELRATCRNCGTRVFREQQPSCIDWCPHAEECVGPEVYQRLRPEVDEDSQADTPLDVLRQEHRQAEQHLNMLRAAVFCLNMGTMTTKSPVQDKGAGYMEEALDFFDTELRKHFHREEQILFPAVETHLGVEKSPTQLLLKEHAEVWRLYDHLKDKVTKFQKEPSNDAIAAEINETGKRLVSLLEEHIRKEDESLVPLAKSLLAEDVQAEIAERWRKA